MKSIIILKLNKEKNKRHPSFCHDSLLVDKVLNRVGLNQTNQSSFIKVIVPWQSKAKKVADICLVWQKNNWRAEKQHNFCKRIIEYIFSSRKGKKQKGRVVFAKATHSEFDSDTFTSIIKLLRILGLAEKIWLWAHSLIRLSSCEAIGRQWGQTKKEANVYTHNHW